ncbi:dTDP-4-dehydrorhamnose 3,5-epimerase family protein [Aliivibrio salmonicida]|uniref:dTDP-4-dehydrorhamnose 3,5-epimerase family protein n=1 Tax=Aliivibrio salmonicida TaxID=40269 RepID=UPI003BF49CA9
MAVDIRKGSPTFGQWLASIYPQKTSGSCGCRKVCTWFYVTSDEAEFVYKCTDYYNPKVEISLFWADESLAINWPLSGIPMLSEKDINGIKFEKIISNDWA